MAGKQGRMAEAGQMAQANRAYYGTRGRRRKRRRRTRAAGYFLRCAAAAVLLMAVLGAVRDALMKCVNGMESLTADKAYAGASLETAGGNGRTQEELLQELLEKNQETLDFVKSYPDREQYKSQAVDLAEDFEAGEVPLLMQWDRRWGYDAYGEEMIGLAGCGPLCLDMAYLYFTGDLEMEPRKMAEYAFGGGYYTEYGTSWTLWTEGAAGLGMTGEELPLDENRIKQVLDSGGLVVCSMGPGDFTTTGHFILIRGYDENGFFVNDPNRRSNSQKIWDFESLRRQIKNLWGLSV